MYLWLGCTIGLFSLSSFKLDYYLLPAMPPAALIIAPVIAKGDDLPNFARRFVKAVLILCSVIILAVASLSLKAAALLSISTPFRFLPILFGLVGFAVIIVYFIRRKTWHAPFVLSATMWATFLALQWVLLPAFVRYLPSTRLAAAAPAGSALCTSQAASDWANSIAFNLPAPHRVERLTGDTENKQLLAALKNDSRAIAVIRESEYANLLAQDSGLKVIARAETFGHGGLSLNVIRDAERETLLLVGHDR
jgi:4-amino-4-deoxy-L-arabinose transferase-like glycosyltransferase